MRKKHEPRDRGKTEKSIRRCQTLRMWLIVLAALLMIGGYISEILPVMYACVLPLAIAAALTYAIKHLERSINDD